MIDSNLLSSDDRTLDFSDLDALLSESLKAKDAERLAKANRKLLSRDILPKEERVKIEKKVIEWETKREWTPEAAVGLFDAQICSHCGHISFMFRGMLQRQSHRSSRIDRWVHVDSCMNNGLPKETKVLSESTQTCGNCAESHGFFPSKELA